MAGYEKLAAEIQKISKDTATYRPVVDEALSKASIGKKFVSESTEVTFDFRVTKPLAVGLTLVRHDPPDGHTIALQQSDADNSLQIVNESSGNTSAYFFPNGKAYLDLLDLSIENRHIDDLSVGNVKMRNDAVDNRVLVTDSVDGRVLADLSVDRNKIPDDEVILAHINSNAKNQSQGTASLRSLSTGLGGSSLSGSPGNHSHLSVNFNSEYTLAEKENSANLKTSVETMRQSPMHTQIYPLIDLVLDLAHQLLDDPGVPVAEKVRRLKEDPAFAHEFRMQNDDEYFAAWAIVNDAAYAAKVQDDPRIQQMAAHAWQVYTRIEDDPAIVEDYKRRRGPFS